METDKPMTLDGLINCLEDAAFSLRRLQRVVGMASDAITAATRLSSSKSATAGVASLGPLSGSFDRVVMVPPMLPCEAPIPAAPKRRGRKPKAAAVPVIADDPSAESNPVAPPTKPENFKGKMSPESRANISAGRRRAWAAKRAAQACGAAGQALPTPPRVITNFEQDVERHFAPGARRRFQEDAAPINVYGRGGSFPAAKDPEPIPQPTIRKVS